MKRILWLAAIFFIITPQIGALGSSSPQSIDIAFQNGSFEQNPAEPGNGWEWPASDWGWDNTTFHAGSHSVRVSRASGGETASLWSMPIVILPSHVYSLTFWLRVNNASKNPSVAIYQYSAADVQTGLRKIAYSNVGNGTRDWFSTTYRLQTEPDATLVRIRIYLYSDTSGTFWFDDINLDQGIPATYPIQSGFPVKATGWVYLSSPSIADINHDGNNELLIGAGNAVNGWDRWGKTLPGYPLSTTDRYIYNQLAIADIDADNRMEIFAGTRTAVPPEGKCKVYAWQDDGPPVIGWPISVDWNPTYSNNDCKVTSTVLADIDNNHYPEVLACTTNNASGYPGSGITPKNLYAWHSDGSTVNGDWPSSLTAAGFYGALAAGDLDNDGYPEVIAARDHHLLNTYAYDGIPLTNWPVTTYLNGNNGDYQSDYRIVYGRSAPVLADLDNNGSLEYIIVGSVSGPGDSTEIKKTALMVLNSDGTRFRDWELPALGNGVLSQEDIPQISPAIGDINADGLPEIIVTSFDGWIRAYDLHKNMLWNFNYSLGATLFASEPVIGDINGDYALEIVFATFVPIEGNDFDGPVGLWSLNGNGTISPGFPMPIPTPGVESAPTLADLDGDGQVDILAATIMGEVIVWDTPHPLYPARLPWSMGRHDLQRTGVYVDPRSFGDSRLEGSSFSARGGDTVTFTIHISSLTPLDRQITLTDSLPNGLRYISGSLNATSGTAVEKHGVIQWSGILPTELSVDITYQVNIDTNQPRFFTNTVVIDTTIEGIIYRKAFLSANTVTTFIPSIRR